MKRLASALVLVVAATLAAPAAAAVDRGLGAATVRKVGATEWSFSLRKRAPRGVVVFRVTNRGQIAHNFKIAGKVTKPILPNETRRLRVTLKKGSYVFRCTFTGHAAIGMKGTFRAT